MNRRPELISALPVPFLEDGRIDRDSARALMERVAAHRVDALFVNGTTGEFPALDRDERRVLLETAVHIAGPERTIAHVGASSWYEAVLLTRDAIDAGAVRCAAITPYYLATDYDAVRRYFEAIRAVAPGLELHLYHYPARTGVQLTPHQAAGLVEEFGLAGIKISMPGVEYVVEVARLVRPDVAVLTGNDGLMVEAHRAGGAGVVSGVSAAVTEPFVDLAGAIETGEGMPEARVPVDGIVNVLGRSIWHIKTALMLSGVIRTNVSRMAVPAGGPRGRLEIERSLERHPLTNVAGPH